MQLIQNIRKTTGIGLQALADFLGMTKQGLAKAEKGIFTLSTANLLKLTRLQACLDCVVLTNNKKQASPAEKEEYIKREREHRYLAAVLQRKLGKAEATAKKLMYINEALSLLTAADEEEALWIKKTKTDIIRKLKTCRVATSMRVQKRIFLHNAEADYLSWFVKENQSNDESGNKFNYITKTKRSTTA